MDGMNEWMDGMDEWMDGWKDGWMHGWCYPIRVMYVAEEKSRCLVRKFGQGVQ